MHLAVTRSPILGTESSNDYQHPPINDPTGADPWGNVRAGFETSITLNRKDFGLTWNATLETGGFLVGDQVRIDLSIQAVAQ